MRADEELEPEARGDAEHDPDAFGAGCRSHARTQNRLHDTLVVAGVAPYSPDMADSQYDLAWQVGRRTYVAEVKSITSANEEKQLRLGLGQVLRYRSLSEQGSTAVLVASREPSDSTWTATCESAGVILLWPKRFGRFARELTTSS